MRRRKVGVLLGRLSQKKLKYIISGIVILLLLVVIFVAANPKKSAYDSIEMAQIRERGAVVIGVRDDIAGFSENGEGLEIELARLLGQEVFDTDSDGNVSLVTLNSRMASSRLSDGTVDVVIMLEPRGFRSSQYAYSDSYYTDSCVFVRSVPDANAPVINMSVGVISDTICESRLTTYIAENENAGITSVKYASYDMMLTDVIRGEIGAAVLSGVYYGHYGKTYAVRSSSVATLPGIEYAFACSVETPALSEIASVMLRELKESGELDALINKYLG